MTDQHPTAPSPAPSTAPSTPPSTEPPLEEAIDIAAPPAAVWALVTDVARMSSWSPQVVRTVVRGGSVGRGTRFVNLNRRGWLFWPTQAVVVTHEPERAFAFRIKENWTVWSFTLEPTEGGTRVTERRDAPHGISGLSRRLTRIAFGGQQVFAGELRAGMRQTLERVKAEAEAG